ncbi:hypothetical protein ABZ070_14105 [Streptomyces sp. NPDC006283]|uniref:hypothetical protein n=1 Tax=Streptomyces sp. NPDC006283 TaxID=3156741 RepID=UPI00339E14A0
MPDRRRRTDLLLPRERQSTDDNNPFAPPPEGRPDQPWQPRHPSSGDGSPSDDSSGSADSPDEGSSGSGSNRGSQWSSRQPGRSSGGFGSRPGSEGNGGSGGQPGGTGGMRWDPTDPAQRRARYALLSGMWAFFFAVFDFAEIALLLGALALYWGISSLRAKPQRRVSADALTTGGIPPNAPPPPPHAPASAATSGGKPQITSAVSGLVMASIALLIVAASFTAQLVYRDYYTCVNDALTKSGQLACNEELP